MSGKYLGNKRVELKHAESGVTILTDAPKDNNGEGRSFSPTDLCAASLAACIVTTMAIKAERDGLADIAGAFFSLEKIMHPEPRRLGAVRIQIHLPRNLDERQRTILERIGKTCPVHRSFSSEVHADVEYLYDVEDVS